MGRSRPSPRSSARAPAIQPRQLSCATMSVTSAIAAPRAAIRIMRYLRVSWLRRSMKLRSCISTSWPTGPASVVIGCTLTCTGPPSICRLAPLVPETCAASMQVSSLGKRVVRRTSCPEGEHQPMATRRSSCTARSNSDCSLRPRVSLAASASDSDSALATSSPRMSRSRANQRSVSWSISGTEK